MFDRCQWLNEPGQWSRTPESLTVVTGHGTDFWRETHYGFTRDSGHFYWLITDGPFTASLRMRASYRALYDQAGIMVRIDEATWLKAGIEWSDGEARLGSVLTNHQSDWATGPFSGDASDVWLRLTVMRGVLRLQASTDGQTWPLVRLCPFPDALGMTFMVGPMCCSPERAGLEVVFSDFSVGPPLVHDLHDLS